MTRAAALMADGGPIPVAGHPDPLSLLASEDPQLEANKRLVFDMWRGIINAGHVELADRLLAEGYIQHSPSCRPDAPRSSRSCPLCRAVTKSRSWSHRP